MKKINVLRMIELEEIAKKGEYDNSLNYYELQYIELALKMPYRYMEEVIKYFKKNWYKIDEVVFINSIKNILNVTEYEINTRLKSVHKIMKYKDRNLNSLVTKQKEMKSLIKSLK